MDKQTLLLTLINTLVTAVATVLASGGFWLFLEKRRTAETSGRDLLLGLAHDRIVTLAMSYIKRGYVSHSEYDNLERYLYRPYQQVKDKQKGDVSDVSELMRRVANLPFAQNKSIIPSEL